MNARHDGRDRPGSGGRGRGAPAPLVAVLERSGRFMRADPVFPAAARPGEGRTSPRARAAITVRPERSGPRAARSGDLVLVAPAARSQQARVIRRLGRPDVARDLLEGLMLDRGLSRRFTERVERDAREAAERVRADAGPRTDLRDMVTFTIDPASARDFDDAISAEARDDGSARVWVHIADVAAHVREGSPLDREARERATSVYVPGAVEPMLPHVLSSDACSLRPGEDRAAVTVELQISGNEVRHTAFYRSLIRSDVRLDYEQVDRIFDGSERAGETWAEPLRVARDVASALAERRERAGALVIDSAEPEFEFDGDGNVSAIHARAQTESHRLIEHLMIAANEAVAELLATRSVPGLFRVHERPDPERVLHLIDQLDSLQVATPPVPDPLSSTQAAELLGAISLAVERHVERAGHGRAALGALVLRSLKQAYYSPQNIGHAGLHSRRYCHFTSPIRRYPDIVCHRALLAAVGGGEQAPRASELAELGAWTSDRERGAMQIERDADDVARCFMLERVLFERGPDRAFKGEVTGLISAGAFVSFSSGEGEEGAFEGMLPVRHLRAPRPSRAREQRARERGEAGSQRRRGEGQRDEREWWELNEQGTVLRGEHSGATIALGDRIEVRVARVDTVRGRVDLLPAG